MSTDPLAPPTVIEADDDIVPDAEAMLIPEAGACN